MCIRDRHGAVEFSIACSESGIIPLIGAELTDGRYSVTAIVQNQHGYRRLSEVITNLQINELPLMDVLTPEDEGLLILCNDSVLLQRWMRNKEIKALYVAPVVSNSSSLKLLLSLVSRRPDIVRRLPAIPVVGLNIFSKEELNLYRVMRAISHNCTVTSLSIKKEVIYQCLSLPPLPFRLLLCSKEVADICTFRFDFHSRHVPRFVP